MDRFKQLNSGFGLSLSIFRINLGPEKRFSVTLLDRLIASRLHKAIFDQLPESAGCYHGNMAKANSSPNDHSPFDYKSLPFVETWPLIWLENFIISRMWNADSSYAILDKSSRTPSSRCRAGPDRPRRLHEIGIRKYQNKVHSKLVE